MWKKETSSQSADKERKFSFRNNKAVPLAIIIGREGQWLMEKWVTIIMHNDAYNLKLKN